MQELKKIGNVSISYLKEYEGAEYSDGDVEDELLALFKNGLNESERRKILNNDPSWAMRYHLAFERENLVNWYNFKPGSTVLEVGSGCGAITEALVANKTINVTANELSERRATINAYRNSAAKNLNIIIGNLQDYHPETKFDYVVCVGVLEYAGTFIDSASPYKAFLDALSKFLKPGGTLLLAIENRMGFKYLSGSKEDHTSDYFDGINNYPKKKNVRTFGREELTSLFLGAGYDIKSFYFPHPDYKLPEVIYSDEFLPGKETVLQKTSLPSPNFDQDRQYFFNEQLFAEAIEKNHMYSLMANSFLVEATCGNINSDVDDKPIFSLSRHTRQPKYRIRTVAISSIKDENRIRKYALTSEAKMHIAKMIKTYNLLDSKASSSSIVQVSRPAMAETGNYIEFKYIKGKNAEATLLDAILYEDEESVVRILDRYKMILSDLSVSRSKVSKSEKSTAIFGEKILEDFNQKKVMVDGILDFNLDNFIIETGTNKWWLIDYEWRMDVPIPVEFIEYRALLATFARFKSMIEAKQLRMKIHSNNIMAIPDYILNKYGYSLRKFQKAYLIENEHIQPWISGGEAVSTPKPTHFSRPSTPEYYVQKSLEMISSLENESKDLRDQNAYLQSVVSDRESLLRDIQHSKSYKLAQNLSRLKNKLKG